MDMSDKTPTPEQIAIAAIAAAKKAYEKAERVALEELRDTLEDRKDNGEGVNRTYEQEDGRTALAKAAMNLNVRLVKTFLENGADPNLQNKYGDTPLMYLAWLYARETDVYAIAVALLEYGGDLNKPNLEGTTPLMVSASTDDVETIVMRLFLEHGANPNAHDTTGKTPLHYLAQQSLGRKEKAILLCAYGADVNALDNAGNTPLDYAGGNLYDVGEFLFQKGGYLGKALEGLQTSPKAMPQTPAP